MTANTVVYTGDTGNDTFVGSAGTLDSRSIDGNGGTDSLSVTMTIADDDNTAFTMSEVETMTIRSTGGTAGDANEIDVEMADTSGLETIAFRRLNDDMNLANVQDLDATISLDNVATAANITVGYDAAIIGGSSDSVNVSVSDSTGGGDLTINGVETIAVTATGEDNDVNVDGDDLETVTVAGAGDISMDIDDSVTTFDASSNTGGVTMVATAAADVTATGGTAADTFNMGTTFNEDDVLDGGDGVDTLLFTAFNTTAGETYSSTGIEQLRIDDAAATVEIDQFSNAANFTQIRVDAGATATVLSDITSGTEVLLTNDTAGTDVTQNSLTLTIADDTGTSDSLDVTLTANGDDAGVDLTATTLSVDEIETVNLELNATSEGSIAVGTMTTNEIETLNVSGAADAELGSVAGMTIETINASTATGDIEFNLGAVNTDVTGGAGDDTFTFGANLNSNDEVDGGLGDDTLTATLAAGVTGATISGVETAALNIGTAGTTFSGANVSTDLTEIEIVALSDEAVVLSNLKEEVASVRLGATAAGAAGDAATISYASGSESAHTIAIGDSDEAADVDLGNVTVSGNAGALTVNSDSFAGNSLYALTANSATSLTINTTEDLEFDDNVGAGTITANDAATVTLNTDGGTLLVDGAQSFTDAETITLTANDGTMTLTGAMTATQAETLTVTTDGDFDQTGDFVSDADMTVSMTSTGLNGNIRYNGILDVDHATTIDLTSTSGGDITIDDIEILGVDSDGDDVTSAINISATGTDTAGDGSAVTITAIDVAAATTLDSVSITGDADSTVSFTTGGAALTITEIDASAMLGELTLNTSTISGAITATLGAGTNSVTTEADLADSITLALADGDDTFNIAAVSGEAEDQVTNFQVGNDGDIVSLDVDQIDVGGDGSGLVNQAGTDLASTLVVLLEEDDDGTVNPADTTNIVVLTDVFADVAAVGDALGENLTAAAGLADDDDILVLWSDGANSYLSALAADWNTTAAGAGRTTEEENLIQFVGINDVTDFTADNFAFV